MQVRQKQVCDRECECECEWLWLQRRRGRRRDILSQTIQKTAMRKELIHTLIMAVAMGVEGGASCELRRMMVRKLLS
ncbi:hypothetical protein BDV38DRAFT_232953 [Aspergillus pseudotamarii]|uniref:Uncharacterized protein n=1 Tax=Aspergillus pseudotamarii TaxID=132259 RepID=A0A5N6TA13_ASPPS|nr:uncharacterized protein BDV38DRAFT_232953 [Aspergillus pseudotamarii]KAE8143208.1 hypothetical protein BDV38DRAFT_232953 [Aspergillus pseudotamarii]